MEFGFTAEQEMLRETARRFLAEAWPAAMARKTRLPLGIGHSRALLARMAELGWLGLALPADAGGAAGTIVDLLVVCEEAGRALVPLTLHLSAAGAAMLSGAPGSGPARLLLPRVLRGDWVLTVAGRLASASPLRSGGFRLDGALGVVPYAAGEADHVLVAASSAGHHGAADVLAALPCDDPAVRAEPACTFAGDPFAMVTLEGAVAGREAIVAVGEAAAAILRRRSAEATVLLCADMVGGAGAVLDLTVRYVRQRVQFKRPLGSFQAVQHHVANMAAALDAARLAVHQAASGLAAGSEAAREVAIAAVACSDTVPWLTRTAHQLHGAAGYVTEHDLYLWSERAKVIETLLGDRGEHLATVAGALAPGAETTAIRPRSAGRDHR